jgi:SAM-dependent methyltransferase
VLRDAEFQPGFPSVGHGILRGLRRNHFWFEHRKTRIRETVNRCLASIPGARILEFGCGDGDVLRTLAADHRAVGFERRLEDLAAARSEGGVALVAGEGAAPPFRRSFDLVGLFDVVEHVADDAGLLRIASSLARPGGWVLLTVPADPRLWTTLDDYAGHRRRYTRAMVESLCRAAALELVSVSPLFRFLWPFGRARAALFGKRPIENPEREYGISPIGNRCLALLLSAERRIFGGSPVGRGTSWLAVARVPA